MGYKHNIEDILTVGTELIRRNGYHKIGINQILKECEIPKGSFYNFFDSKEDFVVQIVQKYGKDMNRFIESVLLNVELSPYQRLHSFYSMLLDANIADEFEGGCLVNTVSNEVGRSMDDIGEAANVSFLKWIETIAACVEEGQELGEIRSDFSAKDLAEYMHAGIYGAFPRMKVTRTREYLDSWLSMTMTFIRA